MHRPPRSRSASIFKRPVVGAALTIVPVLELGKLLVRRSSAGSADAIRSFSAR